MTRYLAAVLALAIVSSCTVTETGNPSVTRVALTADSSDSPRVSFQEGSGLHLTSVWVSVGDVRFVRATECDQPGETEVDVPGPTVVDMAQGATVFPAEVADDDYCRVRVPLERARQPLPSGAPAELEDHSLLIRGALAGGAAFELRSRLNREADVRSRSTPFRLGDAERSLLLSFDLATWFDGIDLAALDETDGVVIVSDDDNRDALDVFEENVERSLRLFEDTDDDGELDDTERSELLASGS